MLHGQRAYLELRCGDILIVIRRYGSVMNVSSVTSNGYMNETVEVGRRIEYVIYDWKMNE